MNNPRSDQADSRPDVAWKQLQSRAKSGLHTASVEIRKTAQACTAQARRGLDYLRTAVQAKRLTRQLQAASESLGVGLYAAGQGDASLRKQLDDLAERRKSVAAARGPTKLLDAERRGLYIRLAAPFVSKADTVENETAEQRQAAAIHAELAAQSAMKARQRCELFPADRPTRRRVALGYAALAALLLLTLRMILGAGGAEQTVADGALTPGIPSKPPEVVKPPTIVPPQESPPRLPEKPAPKADPKPVTDAKPLTQEKWVDEDDYFPRRRAVTTYLNDVPHGECKCFDEQERLIAVEQYRQGKLHGTRVTYYPGGKKFNEITFENGVPVGTATNWFESGTVAATSEFQDGTLQGKSVAYFENGNKFLESTNVQGATHGRMTHYLPQGVAFGVSLYENGQKTGQQANIDPTQSQFQAIQARSEFSLRLKDHWH